MIRMRVKDIFRTLKEYNIHIDIITIKKNYNMLYIYFLSLNYIISAELYILYNKSVSNFHNSNSILHKSFI